MAEDGKWKPGMEDEGDDGRTLKMELLPNLFLTVMLVIGEFVTTSIKQKIEYSMIRNTLRYVIPVFLSEIFYISFENLTHFFRFRRIT